MLISVPILGGDAGARACVRACESECACACDTEIFIHVRYFLGGVRIDFVLLSRSIFFVFTNFRSFPLSLLLFIFKYN